MASLLNDNDLYNSPSQVILDGVEEFCQYETDGVSSKLYHNLNYL